MMTDPPAECAPLHVLIVDDNVDAADSMAMLLNLVGHSVRVAYDGLAGLKAATEWEPDCVLLDIVMPRMSGYDVARRLRSERAAAGVKIVALSAYSDAGHLARLADAGFDHHFVKPADPAVVMRYLAGLASR